MQAMLAAGDNCHWVKDLQHSECFSVALLDSTVVGYLFASIEKDNCQIYIYVLPEYRRRGIGTAICHEAERLCREINEPEMWGTYYNTETKHFADKLNFYFTSSSVHFEYTGDILPEPEICKNIRKCREVDLLQSRTLWGKAWYEIELIMDYPDAKVHDPDMPDVITKDDIDGNYVLEVDGQIIGIGSAKDGSFGSLAVEKEHAGKGYGTAIATYMLNEMLREGHKVVESCCVEGNIGSHRVHDKLGFKLVNKSYCAHKRIEKVV